MRLNTRDTQLRRNKIHTVSKSNKIQEITWTYIEIDVSIVYIILYVNVFHCKLLILIYFILYCILMYFIVSYYISLYLSLLYRLASWTRWFARLPGLPFLVSGISLRCQYPSALPTLQYHSSAGMHLAGRSHRVRLVGPMGGQTGWSTSMHSIAF